MKQNDIIEKRLMLNLSQKEASKLINIPLKSYKKIEQGKTNYLTLDLEKVKSFYKLNNPKKEYLNIENNYEKENKKEVNNLNVFRNNLFALFYQRDNFIINLTLFITSLIFSIYTLYLNNSLYEIICGSLLLACNIIYFYSYLNIIINHDYKNKIIPVFFICRYVSYFLYVIIYILQIINQIKLDNLFNNESIFIKYQSDIVVLGTLIGIIIIILFLYLTIKGIISFIKINNMFKGKENINNISFLQLTVLRLIFIVINICLLVYLSRYLYIIEPDIYNLIERESVNSLIIITKFTYFYYITLPLYWLVIGIFIINTIFTIIQNKKINKMIISQEKECL